MAVMLATAGAAIVTYLDAPEPVRVQAPYAEPSYEPVYEPSYRTGLIDVERDSFSAVDIEQCERGFSSVDSSLGEAGHQLDEFVNFVCEHEDQSACDVLDVETAICIAEERFLGDGETKSVTFLANPFVWVINGQGRRVFVDAQNGDALVMRFDRESDLSRQMGHFRRVRSEAP